MTGRIVTLSTSGVPGSIRGDGGVTVCFRLSEVAYRDAGNLAVGQLVTFDLEKGSPPRALNISVERQHYISHETNKRQQAVRYVGFEQIGNVRAFKFERDLPTGETDRATVTADLSLFQKHDVGIQDGPALCMRLVTAELDDSGESSLLSRSLTDHDMLHHLAERPAKRLPGPRPGGAASHPVNHVWRGTGRTAP